jgi:hypothetical protein
MVKACGRGHRSAYFEATDAGTAHVHPDTLDTEEVFPGS